MKFDKNTIDHFQTLTKLFKRLGIQPKDSYDQTGFNAYHYICAFTPQDLAQTLADEELQEEEEAKRLAKEEKENDDPDGDNEEEEDDEEYYEQKKRERMQNMKGKAPRKQLAKAARKAAASEDEPMADEEGAKLTKEERRKLEKYNQISKQLNEIADTLEKWGYKHDSVALDGHTPFTLAM